MHYGNKNRFSITAKQTISLFSASLNKWFKIRIESTTEINALQFPSTYVVHCVIIYINICMCINNRGHYSK